MSSVTIITDLFRASHVHLKARKKFNDKDTPAFRIAALFPQNGVGEIAALGVQFESSPSSIITAIQEVVMAEWGWEYSQDNEQHNKMNGVQFPPMYKDGDMVLKRDANGQPIPNEQCPISSGNFIFNMKNTDEVGCANGVSLKAIDPNVCYSGCWGRAQLEVSAYTTKGDTPSRIISVKMINFLMCYDDESFGGHGPTQSAEQAFEGMAVTDSNLSASTGNTQFRPEKPAKTSTPPSSLTKTPPAKTPPSSLTKTPPAKTPPSSLTGTVTMNPDSEYTYQELLDGDFSDQDMIEGGYATNAVVKKAPPAKKTPPVKSVPTTGTVIMLPDSEYTYEQLSSEYGWTDEEIVNGGYAKPNFTNPQ